MVLVILFSEFIFLKKKQNQRKRKNKTYNPKKNNGCKYCIYFLKNKSKN